MESIVGTDTVALPLWKIVIGVFLGMWMFAVSAGIIFAILVATGDIPKL